VPAIHHDALPLRDIHLVRDIRFVVFNGGPVTWRASFTLDPRNGITFPGSDGRLITGLTPHGLATGLTPSGFSFPVMDFANTLSGEQGGVLPAWAGGEEAGTSHARRFSTRHALSIY
jgi:hypothetical protein